MIYRLLLAFLLLASPAWATVLSDAAANLPVGQWAVLTTNNIGPVFLNTNGTNGYIISFSDELSWNPNTHEIMFFGGDHIGGGLPPSAFIQGTRHVVYSESTNSWTWLPNPPFFTSPSITFHADETNALDPATGEFFVLYSDSGHLVQRYRAGAWDQIASNDLYSWYNCCESIEYFPEMGGLVHLITSESNGNLGLTLWTRATNTWSRIVPYNTYPGGPSYEGHLRYNPVYHVMLVQGGVGSRILYRLASNGTFTRMADAPQPLGVSQTALVTVDPVSGDYLVYPDATYNTGWYTYNIMTDMWTFHAGQSRLFNKIPTSLNPVEGKVAVPIPVYGVNLFISCDVGSCEVLLYKNSASSPPPPDVTPPTVSMSAPANGSTVSGTVTVSANASDNVGVVGVQFKLDGVNLQAEDLSSPYSISWNTVGVGNGSHSLAATARDAAGNQTTSSLITVTVSNISDVTPPTVALTAPAAGTVSGTVTVSANASDNIGVVGVQFKLDGANLQAEDTVAPYSISWDTTTTTNAGHTLTAVARDAAGNSTTSTGVVVTVSNQVPSSDFATRCAAPGVVRCFDFDSLSEIDKGTRTADNIMIRSNRATLCTTPGYCPDFDSTVKASGAGSLRYTIPINYSANYGSFALNFTPGSADCEWNLTTCASQVYGSQFGEGQTFYVQWRQRFDTQYLSTVYTLSAGSGGWKQANIGTGDSTGFTAYSCTATPGEVVTQNTAQRAFAQMYHHCGLYEALNDGVVVGGTAYIRLQNAIFNSGGTTPQAQYCLYPTATDVPGNTPKPPCIGYFANEWMTFQVMIHIGTWKTSSNYGDGIHDGSLHRDSRVALWVARENQPSTLVLDTAYFTSGQSPDPGAFTPNGNNYDLRNDFVNGVFPRYGKVWLIPYHTYASGTQAQAGYTWYDELIISTQKIADPSGTTATAPSAPTGLHKIP